MNDVALRANDVLRNDVGLRPTMLRYAQTDFEANKKMQTAFGGKGAELNLYLAFLGEIFEIFHRKYLPFFHYFQKILC